MARTINNRVGEHFKNRKDLGEYEFVIIEYNNREDVVIEFQDKHKAKVHTQYHKCKDGGVKNPYHPIIYGVGYIGQGKYKSRIDGKLTKEYDEWKSFLQRSNDKEYKKKELTYKDTYTNEYFYNFQNYCKWREDNYYEVEGEKMCLDKDILIKGNKEYAPDKCIFVPQRINNLFTKNDCKRGNLPIGVNYRKDKNKYEASCSILNNNIKKRKHIGYYNTPEEAFLAYKQFKEQYIKQVADEYKGRIPDRLYEAMYKWEVEIDD